MVAASLLMVGECAATEEPVPSHIEASVPHARLAGQGAFRYFVFHVYDARFWVGDSGYRSDSPMAAPFALELTYGLELKGADIAKTALDEFERLQAASADVRQRWYEQVRAVMPDVHPGQHLTGVFLPHEGLRLYSDGVLVGAIKDVELARWFFAIWLDPRTRDPGLRERLLTDARPQPGSS